MSKSAAIFEKMAPVLEKSGAEIVSKVGAVFLFEIREKKDGEPQYFTIDLKNGNGKVTKGKEGTPDTTFVMLDDDFILLSQGKLKA